MATALHALPPAAIAALQAGNKIEAIKILRDYAHCDLKTAKDAVEAYADQHPASLNADANETVQRTKNGKALIWWLAVLITAALIYWTQIRG